jgi:hypothetical protein
MGDNGITIGWENDRWTGIETGYCNRRQFDDNHGLSGGLLVDRYLALSHVDLLLLVLLPSMDLITSGRDYSISGSRLPVCSTTV